MAAVESQRRVTTLLLGVLSQDGFALAGAGAIREHGLSKRPTHDVDLFAHSTLSVDRFSSAVASAQQPLVDDGYGVELIRSYQLFARLLVRTPDGEDLEVGLGVNWRAHLPVNLAVGPVLACGCSCR